MLVALNMIDRQVMLNEHYLLLMFSMKVSRNPNYFLVNKKKTLRHTIKFGTHFDAVVNTLAMNQISLIGDRRII
jgi:hypothetical protein